MRLEREEKAMVKNIYTVKTFKLNIDGKTKVAYWLGDIIKEGEDLLYFSNLTVFGARPYNCEYFFTPSGARKRLEELKKQSEINGDLVKSHSVLWASDWKYDEKLGANVVKEDK